MTKAKLFLQFEIESRRDSLKVAEFLETQALDALRRCLHDWAKSHGYTRALWRNRIYYYAVEDARFARNARELAADWLADVEDSIQGI